ncbi:Kelch repeat-containing protein [Glycine soja]|nr:Kelch repeat-containing protein [Glycine soja]
MVRASVKVGSAKFVVICVGLLGFALVADFLWASTSSTLPTSTKPSAFVVPSNHNKKKYENATASGRFLAAAYADLDAPQLKWQKMAPAPVPRLDGAAIQIRDLLFVFAGYGTIDFVHSHVDVYNFTDNTWGGRFDMPKEMAHSHLGMVTDGRYIYVVTGQYGPQCRGPTAHNFVLDTQTRKWRDLPPLPVPSFVFHCYGGSYFIQREGEGSGQTHLFPPSFLDAGFTLCLCCFWMLTVFGSKKIIYAPATQLWRGRLHVMGGSKENRHTPGLEHWSLAVKDGKALENEWRSEIPIPRGGPHRACVVVDDRLYVLGGQEGDFMAKPGSPIFKCSRRQEVVYTDVYMLDDDMKWKTLPPMPKANSHIEFAWALVNNSIVIVGGTTEKHPITKKMVLNGEVVQFNLNTLKWSVIGKLPYRVKTTLVGFWNGWLYFTSGQRDKGPDDPSPKKVIGEMWRTKLKLNE